MTIRMTDDQRPEEAQRWTTKRRAALVISLLKGETTAIEATQRHGLKVAEVEGGGVSASCSRRRTHFVLARKKTRGARRKDQSAQAKAE
jgi:hypothetical protein